MSDFEAGVFMGLLLGILIGAMLSALVRFMFSKTLRAIDHRLAEKIKGDKPDIDIDVR